MPRTRSAYPGEFRRQMVELVRVGRLRSWRESSSRRPSRSGTGSARPILTKVGDPTA